MRIGFGTLRLNKISAKILPYIIKAIVTVSLLLWLGLRVNLAGLKDILVGINLSWAAYAAGSFLVSYGLGGLRWWFVLRGIGRLTPLRQLIGLFWIGALTGQVFPNAAADAIRIWIARQWGMDLGPTFQSVVLERVFMLETLFALCAITEPLLNGRFGMINSAAISQGLFAAGVMAIMGLCGFDAVLGYFNLGTALNFLGDLSKAARRFCCSAWAIATLAFCVLGHLSFMACGIFVGTSLNLNLRLYDYILVIPLITLATILPISISGWGIREGVAVGILGLMDIPAEKALAFSLLFGLSNAVASLPAILLLWSNPGKSRIARSQE